MATAGENFALASAGISAGTTIISGFQETKAFERNLTSKVDTKIANMKEATTSYEFSRAKMNEQLDELDEALGDKLTERSMQSLKDQAALRVAAAETGTSGGTTDLAIQEAFMNEHFDKANIISTAVSQQRSIQTQMDARTIKLQSELKSLSTGLPSVETDGWLNVVGGGLKTATQTLSMLPKSSRENLFAGDVNANNKTTGK